MESQEKIENYTVIDFVKDFYKYADANDYKNFVVYIGCLIMLIYFFVTSFKLARKYYKFSTLRYPILDEKQRRPKTNPKEAFGKDFKDVFFKRKTFSGKQISIHGWLVFPSEKENNNNENTSSENNDIKCVVMAHGRLMNCFALINFIPTFTKYGYHCFLVDVCNHGLSDNDDENLPSTKSFTMDVLSTIDYLFKQNDSKFWNSKSPINSIEIGLMGFDVGAAACINATSIIYQEIQIKEFKLPKEIKFLISVGSFCNDDDFNDTLMINELSANNKMIRYYARTMLSVYNYFKEKKKRNDELEIALKNNIHPENSIKSIGCKILLVHGSADKEIPANLNMDVLEEKFNDVVIINPSPFESDSTYVQEESKIIEEGKRNDPDSLLKCILVDGASHYNILNGNFKLLFQPFIEKLIR